MSFFKKFSLSIIFIAIAYFTLGLSLPAFAAPSVTEPGHAETGMTGNISVKGDT